MLISVYPEVAENTSSTNMRSGCQETFPLTIPQQSKCGGSQGSQAPRSWLRLGAQWKASALDPEDGVKNGRGEGTLSVPPAPALQEVSVAGSCAV